MAKSKINMKQSTLTLCQIAVCAALLCVLSPLSVPTPFGVAFTLQVMMVILTALLLKPLHALTAQGVYTLLGLMGLPVFAGYQSGFGVLAGPTGGFLVGFLVASFFVSLFKGKEDSPAALVRYCLVALLVGIPCIYLPGILGFMIATGRSVTESFTLVAAAFLPIDALKCAAAALFAVPVNRALGKIR